MSSTKVAPPKAEVFSVETEVGGKTLRFETGELAKQAGGAVLVTYGETVVLMTATANAKPKTGVSFFPLTVDYEEKMYAAGKIPGGWIKREGRAPERCTLTSRMIDRPIRPLFPEGFRNDTHVVGLCMSVDGENDPDVISICGAGAALAISDIPFDGPVAAVRVGYIDGEFVINPMQSQMEKSQLNLVVAGTRDSICMVEAGAYEVSEQLVLEAIEEAHETIKRIVDSIDTMVKQAGKAKKVFPLFVPDKDLEAYFRKHMHKAVAKSMRIVDKKTRNEAFAEISREALTEKLNKDKIANKDALLAILAEGSRDDFETILETVQGEEMKSMIINDGIRPDGRKTTEIRQLTAKVGILPRTHGTGLFTRGQTQILTVCTLGTLAEEQSFDNIIGEVSRRYIHQYNFPPFSVGEARFMRGPGRREIGHGALAERALVPVIPDENEFPYTLRMVSEALESNGSTSMASVCGSTLALMDAGVPIRAAVGGIAMGLVATGDKYAVLTDIQGLEDHLGDMDFKVAGTRVGITALQMDIKLKGVSGAVLKQALEQARDARFTILDVIEAAIPAPRTEISPRAPHITSFIINPEKIKDVIGPGGKVINRIIAETAVKIDIESDGRVFIASINREMVERAKKIVEDLTRDIEVGATFTGPVMRIMNFGAFVEVVPGKEGLLHVSQLKPYHVARVEDEVKVGDMITFRVEELDSMGRLNLSRKGLYTEEELAQAEIRNANRPPRPEGGGDRDRGPREGGGGFDRGDRDRGPREGGGGFDRGPRPGGDRGDRGPREDRGAESRPPRDFTQSRPPREDRPREDRPRDDRPREARPPREDRPRDDRPREARPPREDRPRDDRPREDRPRDDRPREDRPRDDRPREDRPRDDRPREDRPRDDRPRDDRPREARPPREDRPRDDRPREDRQPREIVDRAPRPLSSSAPKVELPPSLRTGSAPAPEGDDSRRRAARRRPPRDTNE